MNCSAVVSYEPTKSGGGPLQGWRCRNCGSEYLVSHAGGEIERSAGDTVSDRGRIGPIPPAGGLSDAPVSQKRAGSSSQRAEEEQETLEVSRRLTQDIDPNELLFFRLNFFNGGAAEQFMYLLKSELLWFDATGV